MAVQSLPLPFKNQKSKIKNQKSILLSLRGSNLLSANRQLSPSPVPHPMHDQIVHGGHALPALGGEDRRLGDRRHKTGNKRRVNGTHLAALYLSRRSTTCEGG
jgi:hypothetical protein